MASTVASEFVSYLASLNATNEICVALGTTLIEAVTLFEDYEPTTTGTCVVVTSYGGSRPNVDKYRKMSNVQIMVIGKSRKMTKQAAQSIINKLHNNSKIVTTTSGISFSQTSEPLPVEVYEGAERIKYSTNFTVKYVKL